MQSYQDIRTFKDLRKALKKSPDSLTVRGPIVVKLNYYLKIHKFTWVPSFAMLLGLLYFDNFVIDYAFYDIRQFFRDDYSFNFDISFWLNFQTIAILNFLVYGILKIIFLEKLATKYKVDKKEIGVNEFPHNESFYIEFIHKSVKKGVNDVPKAEKVENLNVDLKTKKSKDSDKTENLDDVDKKLDSIDDIIENVFTGKYSVKDFEEAIKNIDNKYARMFANMFSMKISLISKYFKK